MKYKIFTKTDNKLNEMSQLIKILILILFASLSSNAQIVDIPDTNFKNALIEEGVDTNNDGEIQESEAEVVVGLNVSFKDISSMEGIQSFINIEVLQCSGNQLSSLDVSQNINLLSLRCWNNELSSLDVSQNINLEYLHFWNNQLNIIDVSQNLNLLSFVCSNNQLNFLDLSQNINLENLYCDNNQLTNLYINNGNNHNMLTMVSLVNANLICIQIDDENATYPECEEFPLMGWCKDEWAEYSEKCIFGLIDIENTSLSLYPNPVKDILQIQGQNFNTIESIKVYDASGKLVLDVKEDVNQLDVSSLAKGLFFVKIETDKDSVTKKIIKQ